MKSHQIKLLDSPGRKSIIDTLGDVFDDKNFDKEEDDGKKDGRRCGGASYVSHVECSLTRALSVSYMKKLHTSTISPIVVPVRDNSSGLPPATTGNPTNGKKYDVF
jgi:hypothetical protein